MKTNEAPKNKFVYPNKLYARCKDNKTLDVSYAPQNMEVVEYTRTDAFIEKACDWLESVNLDFYQIREGVFSRELVEDFKKYLDEE